MTSVIKCNNYFKKRTNVGSTMLNYISQKYFVHFQMYHSDVNINVLLRDKTAVISERKKNEGHYKADYRLIQICKTVIT